MAREEHIGLIHQGVAAWNRWRADNPDIRPDLVGAGLRCLDLTGANLDDADLKGADLHGTILNRASLVRANLAGANQGRARSRGYGRMPFSSVCNSELRPADRDTEMAVGLP
jgi:uncharacterized protein YjbI with pentapeptide repeats